MAQKNSPQKNEVIRILNAAALSRKLLATTAMTMAGMLAMTSSAFAVGLDETPTGGEVVAGSSTITYGAGSMTVDQTSQNSVINWNSFNLGKDATATYNQPNAQALSVNRVTGGGIAPSQIQGTIKANGRVMILDPNGVFFSKTAVVDVNSLIASTGTLDGANQQKLMAGEAFDLQNVGQNPNAKIENAGSISAAEGGLVAFVAPWAANSGFINAKLGQVTLAAGNRVTVDLAGDNLISIAVGDKLQQALVENSGTIDAQGGTVVMAASAAKGIVDDVVNMSGVLQASSFSQKGGKIVLSGGDSGVVNVSGTVKASGKTGGGTVDIKGENILVADSATVSADATDEGNGGTVNVVAQNGLIFGGLITARGGALWGNGGFVETSGLEWVDLWGDVDASAPNGLAGTWFIDPRNLDIVSIASFRTGGDGSAGDPFAPNSSSGAGASRLKVSSITGSLNGGTDVYVTTVGSPNVSGQDGTITIKTDIIKNGGGDATLYLNAAGSIVQSGGTTISSSSNKLNLDFTAVNNIDIKGDIDTNGGNFGAIAGGDISFSGFSTLSGLSIIPVNSSVKTGGGNMTFAAGGDFNVNDEVSILGLIDIGGGSTLDTEGGDLTATAGKNVKIANDVNTGGGDVSLAANGAGLLEGITTVTGPINAAGGDIDIFSQGAFIGGAETLRTEGTGTITLNQNSILGFGLQMAIDALKNTGNGLNTINVGSGIFIESVNANEDNLLLQGAGSFGSKFEAGGVNVTGDRVTVDGFDFNLLSSGVTVGGTASFATVSNNRFALAAGGVSAEAGASDLSVTGNTFTGLLGSGVTLDGVLGADVSGNTFSALGGSAVAVTGGDSITISGNGVALTGGPGISIVDSTNATVSGNTIGGTAGSAIFADPSTGSITGNTITLAGGHGIEVLGGTFLVSGNTIAGAAGDGIHVDGGSDHIITDNGTLLTAGDGISLARTLGYYIGGNTVGGAGGDGIAVTFSGPGIVNDNTIIGTADDGIAVTGTAGVAITNNNASLTGGNGISLAGALGYYIGGNTVTAAGGNGISVALSSLGLVNDNKVFGAAENGIALYNVGLTGVTGNFATLTGGDGIHLGGLFNLGVGIFGNATLLTGGNGIYASRVKGLEVAGNIVTGSGEDGIALYKAFGADVGANVVTGSADDGISVTGSNNVDVALNLVSLSGDNGVQVINSTDTNVGLNVVSLSGNNGVFVDPSTGSVFGNVITGSGNNGIEIKDSNGYLVAGNIVSLSGNNGIFLNNADDTTVFGNFVTASGGDGIRAVQSNGIWLGRNHVKLSAGNGISVFGGYGIGLNHNRVSLSGNDGVSIWGARDVLLRKNRVSLSGGDGFDIGWSSNVVAWGNSALLSAENGFEVTNSCDVDLGFNLVALSGENGVFAANTSDLDIFGNVLFGGLGNGVTLVNTPHAVVAGNSISGFENGISAFFSRGVNILYNRISHVWNDGVQGYFTNGIRVVGNLITNYGDDGVQIAYSHGLGFFRPVLIAGNTIVGNLPTPAPEDEKGGDLELARSIYVEDEVRGGGNTGIRLGDNEGFFGGDSEEYASVERRGGFVSGDFSGVQGALIINNDILNNDVGLDARAFNNGYININSNRFTDNQIGMWIGSGLIDLRGTRNTIIDEDSGDVIPVGNIFHGGDTAMIFERAESTYYPGYEQQIQALCIGECDGGGGPVTSFAFLKLAGDTLGTTVFEEQTNYYVDLRNGAFFDPGAPTIIDGQQALWDGVWGGLMSASQLQAIEAKLNDYDDDVSLGQIFAGWFLSLNDNQILKKILNYRYGSGRGSVIVKGLPFTGLVPGFSLADLANIEPAAGGDDGGNGEEQQPVNGHCWGALGGGGGAFEIGLDGDPSNLLSDIAACFQKI